MNLEFENSLYQVKNSLISEINQNFNANQYRLINAVAEAAINMLYEEAMSQISKVNQYDNNELSKLVRYEEKYNLPS